MEDDEDVIFQGSALYHHLQETGFTDFEASDARTSATQQDFKCNNGIPKAKKMTMDSLKEKVYHICSTVSGTTEAKSKLRKEVIGYAAESGLLNEDDWLLLGHFVPEGEELRISSQCRTFGRPDLKTTAAGTIIPRFVAVAALYGALAIVGSALMMEVAVAIFVVTLVPFWLMTSELRLFLRHRSMAKEMKGFLHLMKMSSYFTSRSLRLLLEVDLIARGFVLAQGSTLSCCDTQRSPQIASLQTALHTCLAHVSQVLHNVHRHMQSHVLQYPCMRQLFNPEDIQGEISLGETSDVKMMKKMVTLQKLQVSAIITELVLCLNDPEATEKIFFDCSRIFSTPYYEQVKDQIRSLKKHLSYAQSFWLNDEGEEKKTESYEEKKSNVYLAVHSLSLHMQAALFRVQELEKKFEDDSKKDLFGDMVPSEGDDLPSYELVKEQLNIIKIELDLCSGCWEEAETRVNKKYGIPEVQDINSLSSDTLDGLNIHENDLVSVPKKPPILITELDKPVIEDEVFEAYVDEEYSSRQTEAYDDDFWNSNAKKERQLLRQQREQGKRVFNELRPILVKRREVWEKRELAALKRQHGEDTEVSDPVTAQSEETDSSKRDESSFELVKEDSNPVATDDEADSISSGKALQFVEPFLCVNEYDDIDCDEERLERYRKVKQELEEDEKNRLLGAEGVRNYRDEVSSSSRGILKDCEYVSDVPKYSEANKHNLLSSKKSVDDGEIDKDEEFSCGNDKERDSDVIDWSTMTLPVRPVDTLEDRLQLFCGGQNFGFQAELAAAAQVASQQFFSTKNQGAEIFGGIGEGEEVFGSEDDEDMEEEENVQEQEEDRNLRKGAENPNDDFRSTKS